VDDAATAALMGEFYRQLWEEGRPPLEALRRAQLAVYREPGRFPGLARGIKQSDVTVPDKPAAPAAPVIPGGKTHPALWAAFILSGAGR
jgi:CHAT domain-containing protein